LIAVWKSISFDNVIDGPRYRASTMRHYNPGPRQDNKRIHIT